MSSKSDRFRRSILPRNIKAARYKESSDVSQYQGVVQRQLQLQKDHLREAT